MRIADLLGFTQEERSQAGLEREDAPDLSLQFLDFLEEETAG